MNAMREMRLAITGIAMTLACCCSRPAPASKPQPRTVSPEENAAQLRAADDWARAGAFFYNEASFEAAIRAFKQAYAADPASDRSATYLKRIGDAYYQLNDCNEMKLWYKRYVWLADRVAQRLDGTQLEELDEQLREARSRIAAVQCETRRGFKPPSVISGRS